MESMGIDGKQLLSTCLSLSLSGSTWLDLARLGYTHVDFFQFFPVFSSFFQKIHLHLDFIASAANASAGMFFFPFFICLYQKLRT